MISRLLFLSLFLLPAVPVAAAAPQDPVVPPSPVVVDSTLTEVTVYTRAAFVKRAAEAPAGGGTFVIAGLPSGLDRDALRLRCDGAEVVGVETRDRIEEHVPEARLGELRASVAALEDRLAVQEDEDEVLAKLEAHLDALFRQEERGHAAGLAGGEADVAAWEPRLAWLTAKLSEVRASRREAGWAVAETRRELEDLRAQLGRFESSRGARVVDVHVELVDTSGAPARLEVEYLVGNAGWTPVYDLRARKDLSKVELVYRARVWQRTGEDWTDVGVLLSTAQPQRGAAGPEPRTVWLDLVGRRGGDDYARGAVLREVRARKAGQPEFAALEAEALDKSGWAVYEAEVLEEGLTVRYRLPRRETIESRPEPSTVLVGRADLDVTPEHVVVPALDTTVWLRARTTNTSDWVLLPGRAAVYFGADYLGHADLPAVQRTEELTLHLGADPGLAVERILVDEQTEEPGLFGSRETLRQKLRFKLKNHGAFSASPDGAVTVVLHESIPRPNDERVEVEIEEASPKAARGPRWDELREEKGVETWLVRVAKGGERVVDLELAISYPEDLELRSF